MQLTLIAGPNGAGKTTAAGVLVPEVFGYEQFVNADNIAAGLSPFAPDTVALQAGRIMLQRIRELVRTQASFAFETTLATRSFAPLLQEAREAGYRVRLIYLWLASSDIAVRRVAKRVTQGGHHIPEDVIHRRYMRGVKNLFSLYMPLADFWEVYDNTNGRIELIACGVETAGTGVAQEDLWNTVRQTRR